MAFLFNYTNTEGEKAYLEYSKKDQIKYEKFILLPKKLQKELLENSKFDINVKIDKKTLESYIDFLINGIAPEINEENGYIFKLLEDEFDNSNGLTRKEENKNIIAISALSYIEKNEVCDYSYISQNIHYFLVNHREKMKKIKLQTLYNIISNVETSKNMEIIIDFIIELASENQISSFLLNSLNYDEIKYETFMKIIPLYHFDDKNTQQFFENYNETVELLERLYASNIRNRLIELVNPTEYEKIRWPMELIQNAKDSLYSKSNTTGQKKVKIQFIYKNEKEIIFSHNGPPFTNNSYIGLLYKISAGKNNENSTGKFGTGFLTSHVLSKTVKISGNKLDKNDKNLTGFSITLLREKTEVDGIIDDFRNMRKGFKKIDPVELTTFVYPIKPGLSSTCAKLGIDYLKEHVSLVLINCPDIESISIIENETENIYSAQYEQEESIFRYRIMNNKNVERNFIVLKNDDSNISIEINANNEIVPNSNKSESIYVVFPIIGSNKHILPFYLNSKHFVPTTERDSLVLYGEDQNNGEKTSIGINREILMKSIDLFQNLIIYLNKIKCPNMHELTNGLSLSEKPYDSFDLDWYKSVFLEEMRKKLLDSIAFEVSSGKKTFLREIIFPSSDIDSKYISQFLGLSITKQYFPEIISCKDCEEWRDKILTWGEIHFITIENLIEKVIGDSSILKEDKLVKMNEFLSFIFTYNKNLFDTYTLIPNMNYELKYLKDLSKKFRINEIHDHLNQLIKTHFNDDLNKKVIHSDIKEIFNIGKEIQFIEFNKINEGITKLQKEKQIQVAESIISIFPQDNEKQKEIFTIYQKLKKTNLKNIEIDDNFFVPKFWEPSNKIILLELCHTIESTKCLNEFQNKFSLNEEESFKILNFIYTFDFLFQGNDNHLIIPNKEGNFKGKKELKLDNGIDDGLLELYQIMINDCTLQKTITHSKVTNRFIEEYKIADFYTTLNNMVINELEKQDKNPKIMEHIKKIFTIDISGEMSEKQKSRMDMLKSSHVKFIKNRINELENATKWDYMRWPFELIQNATDCIQKESEGNLYSEKNGHISFIFDTDRVVFTHFGSPFTYENYISLLYQYGGGKSENKSLIGRFGTGFLSTMILSRKVKVTGDLIKDNKISSFEATIDRRDKDNLQNGIDEMEKSLKSNPTPIGKTEFTFYLETNLDQKNKKRQEEAYKLGLESLKKNIPPSLIFNPSIKSISLTDKNEILTYSKGNDDKEGIKTVIEQSSNNPTNIRSFIYHEINDKYENKNVNIICLLEYGPQKNIIYNEDFLFLAFPIFGDKHFNSPIIINSLEIEPKTERNDIKIQLNEEEIDSYESSINKFIISKTVNMFHGIIKRAIEMECTDFYNICQALKSDSKSAFFQEEYITKMRNIILEFPIFQISEKLKLKHDSIIIPFIDENEDLLKEEFKNDKIKVESEFYDLVSDLNIPPSFLDEKLSKENGFLVSKEHFIQWNSFLWEDFHSRIGIYDLLRFIADKKEISKLPCKNESDKYIFIEKVIEFVKKMKDCSIVVNSKEYNILLTESETFNVMSDIYDFTDLPSIFISLMNLVEYDYQKHRLHPKIEFLYKSEKDFEFKKFEIEDAKKDIWGKINEAIPKNDKSKTNYDILINLMQYVVDDNEKREKMFKFTKYLLKKDLDKISISKEFFSANIPAEKMFGPADEYVIKLLIKEIQKLVETNKLYVKQNIDFLYEFVEFLNKNISIDEFQKTKLIPNQLYELCLPQDLKQDLIKDENQHIKIVLKNALGIDLQKRFILDKFSKIVKCKDCELLNISEEIIKNIQNVKNEHKADFYEIVLSNSVAEKKLPSTIEMFNFFFRKNATDKKIKKGCFLFELTEKVRRNIVIDINSLISKYSNINTLILTEKFDNQEIYKNLAYLYVFSMEYKFNEQMNVLFPTEKGELKKINEIRIMHNVKKKYSDEIEDEEFIKFIQFLDIFIKKYGPKDVQGPVEDSLLHKSIIIPEHDLKEYFDSNIIDFEWISRKINDYKEEINFDLNHDYPGPGGISSQLREFINLVSNNKIFQVTFYDFIDNAFGKFDKSITNNLEVYRDFTHISKDLKEIQKKIVKPANKSVNELQYAIVVLYDELQTLKLHNKYYTSVQCKSISTNGPGNPIIYNNITYFYNEENKDENFDIVTKDIEKYENYILVKFVNDGINLTKNQISFSTHLDDQKKLFTLIQILDETNNYKIKNQFSVNLKI